MKRTLFERIKIYQEKQLFHPLTCRIDDCRADLLPAFKDENVVLLCPKCSEVQTFIPPIFLDEGFDEMMDSQIAMFDNFRKIIKEEEQKKNSKKEKDD